MNTKFMGDLVEMLTGMVREMCNTQYRKGIA